MQMCRTYTECILLCGNEKNTKVNSGDATEFRPCAPNAAKPVWLSIVTAQLAVPDVRTVGQLLPLNPLQARTPNAPSHCALPPIMDAHGAPGL